MKLQFLWEPERTRNLFRTHLILFIVGGVVATVYTLLLPPTTPYREIVVAVPSLFTVSCLFYFATLRKLNPYWLFLIFTLEGQFAASIFMAVTGGFLGIVQFAPYMFLIFSVFELGADAAVVLGVFSVMSFVGILVWTLIFDPQPNVLQEFFYYVGSYILIVFVERNVGREISLQIEARKKLEGIDDIKNQFITLASHALRTPLARIKWFTSEFSEMPLSEAQKKEIGQAKGAISELETLAENLLTISSIEKGHTTIVARPTDIGRLAAHVVQEMAGTAQAQGITLTLVASAVPLPMLSLDEVKIQQVIVSLVDNAIRYNRPGGKVDVTLSRDDKNVTLEVADTGIGMKQGHLRLLFTTFNRGSYQTSLHPDRPGTGLSLYVTKLIIDAHGGKISVQSEEAVGSTFRVTFPIK